MYHSRPMVLLILLACGPMFVGCQSPYYADRGAAFGGLTGAGVGALVGDASGNAGAGAVLGAGIGALTGAAVGGGLDEIAARNQAEIARQMGRAGPSGAATVGDVVAMSQAGVEDRLIVAHIRNHGVAGPLTAADVISLHQQNVPTTVIEAMQNPVAMRPRPVIVQDHFYGPPPPPHCLTPRGCVHF